MKYVDTKNQLEDILMKGSFTRDEWNYVLRLFNFMNRSMFSCSFFITQSASLRPMWNLVSKTVDRSPIAPGSSASHSPGTLKAKSSNLDLTSTGKLVARYLNENTASSSQVWHSDVNPDTRRGKPVEETTKNPSSTKFSHRNRKISRNNVGHLEKVCSNVRQKTWSSTRRRCARDQRQRDDLGNIHVRNYESRGTSWTRLSR